MSKIDQIFRQEQTQSKSQRLVILFQNHLVAMYELNGMWRKLLDNGSSNLRNKWYNFITFLPGGIRWKRIAALYREKLQSLEGRGFALFDLFFPMKVLWSTFFLPSATTAFAETCIGFVGR